MNPKTTSAALSGLAVLALVAVQFMPWAHYDTDGGSAFGFSFPDTSIVTSTWKVKVESGGSATDEGWYSDDAKDYSPGDSNLMLIRIAVPLVLVALIGSALACLLSLNSRSGPVIAVVTAVFAIAGTVLMIMGLEDFYGDAAQAWGPSYYAAMLACIGLVAGGVLGLTSGRSAGASY